MFEVLSRFIQKWIQPPACWDQGFLSSIGGCTFICWKNPPKCCSFLVWIAVCWFSSNILLTNCNPKNNCWLSCLFGARFGRKDRRLSPYNPRLMSFSRPFLWYHSEADPIGPDGTFYQTHMLSYTAKTKYRNLETNIPRKGISGSQSQFPHSCVWEWFIYYHDRSAYPAGGNM